MSRVMDRFRHSSQTHEENEPGRRRYEPGYEPSAPPYFPGLHHHEQQRFSPNGATATSSHDLDEFPHSRHAEGDIREPREPFFGQPEGNETLGGYLYSRIARILLRRSQTVVKIDLRRSLLCKGPVLKKGRHHGSAPSGTVASSGGANYNDEQTHLSQGWLNGISGGGGRLKVMQIWDTPKNLLGESIGRWHVNVGFGLNLEVDNGHIQPKLRVKARHVALHLLPRPEVELSGRWPFGGTRLAVYAKYRIPLTLGLEELWMNSGARLTVNFFNPLGTGVHLTPGGVEFDEHLFQIGEHTKLRIAAAVEFPRKFPLEEGDQPIKLRVYRLGLKTLIQYGVNVKED